MNGNRPVKKIIAAVCVCVISGLASSAPAADNPLKEEMRRLDAAFKNLVGDVALGNLSAVEGHFHELHALKEKTHAALEKGEIKLPKNGGKIKLFEQYDASFHKKLEQLIKASKKDNIKAVRRLTHRLLDACIRCHGVFRQ
ncbi:MAG: hypothetical protein HZB82_07345 [Deltaproteobacteria bacterium]|nr:hypothetical protein [Deltaproteobacteria bacterium]